MSISFGILMGASGFCVPGYRSFTAGFGYAANQDGRIRGKYGQGWDALSSQTKAKRNEEYRL